MIYGTKNEKIVNTSNAEILLTKKFVLNFFKYVYRSEFNVMLTKVDVSLGT